VSDEPSNRAKILGASERGRSAYRRRYEMADDENRDEEAERLIESVFDRREMHVHPEGYVYFVESGADTFCLCGCVTSGPDDPICPWCQGWCPMCGAKLPVRAVECECGAVSPVKEWQ
jgi:hypothetical protein